MTDDKKTLNQIILDINKTERNYILKKGETTVEIEAAKSQNNYDKSFTDNLKSLVDSISKLRVKDQ
jgi:flagellar hook-basal body complex protein FliE